MSIHVKFETPKELQDEAVVILEKARETGKIKKGTNEATNVLKKALQSL